MGAMKKLKRVMTTIIVLLFLLCAGSFALSKVAETYNLDLGMDGENFIPLNRDARKGCSKSSSRTTYMFYEFTENQRQTLVDTVKKYNGASIQVDFIWDQEVFLSEDAEYGMGFLYPNDFDEDGKIKKLLDTRETSSGTFYNLKYKGVSVSQCLKRNFDIPRGFFVYGKMSYHIADVRFTNPKLGFDINNPEKPVYALGCSGGRINLNSFTSFDFSDGRNVFPKRNSKKALLPKITLDFTDLNGVGTVDNQTAVQFVYGSEELLVRRTLRQKDFIIQSASVKNPYSTVRVESNASQVIRMMMEENLQLTAPLPTDLGMIPDWPKQNWRNENYEYYSWQNFPHVLFFDFSDYKTQDRFFSRLAFFVEKIGYIGTLVDNDFIERTHGYNAHDYKADDLAAFFTKAYSENFVLNEEELVLRDALIQSGIIRFDGHTFIPGEGAVISIARESADALRWLFLNHESWHGIYFVDEEFREFVREQYDSCDPQTIEFLKQYWLSQPNLMYDRNNLYLMHNEFMAYILQQSLSEVRDYFVSRTGMPYVMQKLPVLAWYIRTNRAEALYQAGSHFDEYVFDRWGFACGRVSLIRR